MEVGPTSVRPGLDGQKFSVLRTDRDGRSPQQSVGRVRGIIFGATRQRSGRVAFHRLSARNDNFEEYAPIGSRAALAGGGSVWLSDLRSTTQSEPLP